MLYNLATVRSLIWDYAMTTPLSNATNAEKATFLSRLNVCTERLLTEGQWRGTRQRADLPIIDGHITLPRYLESCLGVNLSTCFLSPRTIYSIYAPFQIALDDGWTTGVIPVSEVAQTFIVPASGFKLKFVTFPMPATLSDEARKNVKLIGGTDTSRLPIYTTTQIALNLATPPTTTQVYGTLPNIQKDITTGPVYVYSVIGTVTELIAIYFPSETVPSYKRYKINNPGTLTSCSALCKLAFVPAVDDTDLIFPSVVGALIKGIQAVQYEIKSDDRDKERWDSAKLILQNDREQLDGKMMLVVETVGEFGAGSTPNLVGDYWGAMSSYGYAAGCGGCLP